MNKVGGFFKLTVDSCAEVMIMGGENLKQTKAPRNSGDRGEIL
jgi:hypothetical protein